jgi:hypothetical protein
MAEKSVFGALTGFFARFNINGSKNRVNKRKSALFEIHNLRRGNFVAYCTKVDGKLCRTGQKKKETEDCSSVSARHGRVHPDDDLHEKAGGSPLCSLSAPNIHPSSKRGREVCKPRQKYQASRINDVGPNGHITHQAGF